MSRTTLCVVTAAALAVLSVTLMLVRRCALGDEVVPTGPGTWRVTLAVQGRSRQSDAKLVTAAPLDFGRQHVLRQVCRSAELLDKPPDARNPDRHTLHWGQRAGVAPGPFRARAEFYVAIDQHRATGSMSRLHKTLYAPPGPGQDLDVETRNGTDHEKISALARRLTAGLDKPVDQAQALYRFVAEEVAKEPSVRGPSSSAAECLEQRSGDSRAKSRLLVALLRNRGIPARLVTGVALAKGPEQQAHYWVEAWVNDHWLAACPFHRHFGTVPSTYLVFGFGDLAVARSPGNGAHDLNYAFLVEHVSPDEATGRQRTWLQRTFTAVSLYVLPPAEQKLVEFLLLLPVAALIICVFRNVIGLQSFGTFAPALVGLAFRGVHSLPGLLVFVGIVLVGWMMRRLLDRYHLLQVPRVAFLLSLVMALLIALVVAANFQELPATKYVSLFPMVILTGMIERFWTLESEDGTASSFKTLLSTMFIAAVIALVLGVRAVLDQMFRYPETLGLVMACQLLIGRYTGYRLTELFRFRDFTQPAPIETV
jgi:7 transmembrane helices usually fused to an inactive transglutaminase/Transglutaminase-like superfamily